VLMKNIILLILAIFCVHGNAQIYFDRLDVDNIRLDANTVSTTNTNGDLLLSPNGTGAVQIPGLTASTVPYLDSGKRLQSSATTTTELGYLHGVTSAIQTQMGLKAPLASPTFTGTVTTPVTASRVLVTGASSELAASTVTSATLAFLDIGSSLTTLLSAKAPLASPTFSGTITTPLTASRVLVTGASSELAASGVTSATLAFLDIGSSLTTLLAAKAPLASPTFTGTVTTPLTTAGPVITSGAGVLSSEAQLAVSRGGTGLASGTSGGILGYTASGTLASSGALAANQIVLGGGAGATPSTLSSLGTTTTLLHGNAAGAPTFGAVSLTADVSGVLPIANGGTNNGSLAVTAGGVLYTDGSKLVNMGAGISGQVLTSAGAGVPTWGAGGTGGSSGINILAAFNRDAESGTTNWTNTGSGTFTTTTTAANVANGAKSFSFDAAAANDVVSSDAQAIPAGLYGANCLAQFYYLGFDSNITAQVYDGTNVIASQALTAASAYKAVQINFVCPSSGNLQLRFLASANAAIGYWDEVHLGSALNISNSSQAKAFGSVTVTACSAAWTVTNTSLTAFGTQTSCSYAATGSASAPGTNIPGITFATMPPGDYVIEYEGFFNGNTSGNNAYLQFTDGTNTARELSGCGVGATTATTQGCPGIRQTFTYTTAQSNVTWQLKGKIASGAISVFGTTANPGVIRVYYFPPSASQTLADNLGPQSWAGYHDNTCSWARTNTSYGDPTADASCALVERLNRNFGTVSTSGGVLPAITFTPKQAGRYWVCATAKVLNSAAGTDNNMRLWDGTTVIAEAETYEYVINNIVSVPICGLYYATSTSAVTLSVQTKAASNTVTIAGNAANASSLEWSIFAMDQAMNAPVLIGSVTSGASGAERIERAKINCDSSSAILSQSGSWITAVGNIASGACAVTIATGMFSAAPTCTLTANAATYSAPSGSQPVMAFGSATTTTALSVKAISDASGISTAFDVDVICMGPK
jgi:hypothetical protein